MTRRLFWTKFSLCKKQRIRSSSLSDFGQNKTFELRVNFSAELSKMHSTHSMESLGKNHLQKKNTFFIFTQNFEAVLSKLYSNCPEEHFEVYFWIFHFVPSFSDNEKKTVGRLPKTTQQCFKTWFLLVQGKNLRKVFFLKFASSSSHFEKNFSSVSAKKMGAVLSKPCFKCPAEHFQGKIPSEKNPHFFLSISAFELKFFGFLSEVFQPGCQSYNLRILYNFLRKIHCFEKTMFFSSLWEFRRRILDFLRKNSGRFVKIVFAVSSRKIWGKQFLTLSEFGLKLFWPSMENFRQFCQNCFLRLQRKVLRDCLFTL